MDLVEKIVLETDSIFFDERLRGDVSVKGESDYVTRADIEISEYLHKRLKEEFPEIGFISEEGDTNIDEAKDYWILDPIDGTTNFIHRLSFCGVSLALFSKGEIMSGIIYVPYTKEMFRAEKGKGAYLNGKPIKCSSNATLSECIGILEFNAYFKNDCSAALKHADKIYNSCQDIRTFGSAAVELAYIACGKADVFLGRYLKPWDYAAGVIIVEEAGGRVTDLERELHISRLNTHIIASNAAVYEKFLNLIKSEEGESNTLPGRCINDDRKCLKN